MNPYLEEARRLRLKKRLSQNFLIQERYLDEIVRVVNPQPEDTLLEIGAGAGFLTRKLLGKVSRLVAVEIDPRLVTYLKDEFRSYLTQPEPSALDLIQADILKFDPVALSSPTFKVVGNLPYHITSPILFLLTGELNQPVYPLRQRIRQATLMVQKEVGERITALPGCKAYNPLSIAVQFWFDARLDFVVPANAYYPAPKVDSCVITLTPRLEPRYLVQDLDMFSRIIHAAFHQRRKKIRNTAAPALSVSIERWTHLLEAAGIDPDLRAEAVSIERFGALANVCSADHHRTSSGKD